jgi:tight adherence protein B
MNMTVLLLVAMLVMAGVALTLFLRASAQEKARGARLRQRAEGDLDSAETLVEPYRPRKDAIRDPITRWLCTLMWRTGSEVAPEKVFRIWLPSVVVIVPTLFLVVGWLGALGIGGLAVVLGWAWMSRKASARRALMLEQLPGYLEATMRVLSAGNTLEESLAVAAREAPEPLQPLMASVGRQVRLGAPTDSVLMEAAEIHQMRDLKVMAMAAAINRKYGGSLRNILRSLVAAIRSREMAQRELRALTAETRFSAVVLSVLPIGISLYVYLQNPDYYTTILQDSGGRLMMLISLGMQLAGIVVLVKMMRSTDDPT